MGLGVNWQFGIPAAPVPVPAGPAPAPWQPGSLEAGLATHLAQDKISGAAWNALTPKGTIEELSNVLRSRGLTSWDHLSQTDYNTFIQLYGTDGEGLDFSRLGGTFHTSYAGDGATKFFLQKFDDGWKLGSSGYDNSDKGTILGAIAAMTFPFAVGAAIEGIGAAAAGGGGSEIIGAGKAVISAGSSINTVLTSGDGSSVPGGLGRGSTGGSAVGANPGGQGAPQALADGAAAGSAGASDTEKIVAVPVPVVAQAVQRGGVTDYAPWLIAAGVAIAFAAYSRGRRK